MSPTKPAKPPALVIDPARVHAWRIERQLLGRRKGANPGGSRGSSSASIPPRHLKRVSRTAGWISPVVLVDGMAAGVWDSKQTGKSSSADARQANPPSRGSGG